MRPAISQRVFQSLAALDRRLWLAVLGFWAAGRLLTNAQHILAAPDPYLVAMGCGLLIAAVAMRRALPHDRSLAIVLESFAAFMLSVAVLAPLSYVATRSPFPAIDGALASIDRAVGFVAPRARATVYGSPVLSWLFTSTYLSVFPQYLVALAVLPRTSAPLRGLVLMRLSMLTLCLSYAVVFLFPTIGTMPAVEAWAHDWHSLHDSRETFDSRGQIQAIVSLPSYHAAMAVMLGYSLRGLGVLSWIVVAVDGLVLLVTPVMGFHHVADVVAGMAVAVTSIVVVNASSSRRHPGNASAIAPSLSSPAGVRSDLHQRAAHRAMPVPSSERGPALQHRFQPIDDLRQVPAPDRHAEQDAVPADLLLDLVHPGGDRFG